MTKGPFSVEVVLGPAELARAGAKVFETGAQATLKERSLFTVALSGGTTPQRLYQTLASDRLKKELPWEKVHFFWSDERNVAADQPRSNFHMVWAAMLSHLPIPESNIHRIRTELQTPQAAAEDYESTLRSFFKLSGVSEKPRFDLVFLGLGPDGHTASLFPDGQPSVSIAQKDPNRLVFAPWVNHLGDYRISLTPGVLNEASRVIFLVSGKEKAPILAAVLEGDESGLVYPAQSIQPVHGKLTWLVDQAAASALKKGGF